MKRSTYKGVWGRTERNGIAAWTRVGHAWEEADGAIGAHIHAFPLSGRICIKDGEEPVESGYLLEAFEEAVQ